MTNPSERFSAKLDKEMKSGLMSLLVLHVIDSSEEPAYGYKIVKLIEERSQDKLTFPEGTIYPILRSLQNQELLQSYWGESLEGPQRKYYELTKEGKSALKIGLENWKELSQIIDKIINRSEGRK